MFTDDERAQIAALDEPVEPLYPLVGDRELEECRRDRRVLLVLAATTRPGPARPPTLPPALRNLSSRPV